MGRVETGSDPRWRRHYLARHPAAALYAGFADFAFMRVSPERLHWIGGFGRAAWIDDMSLFLTSPDFAETEEAVIADPSDDHPEMAATVALKRLGRRGKGWRFLSVDADGCDLGRGSKSFRVDFDKAVRNPTDLDAKILEMAE